MSHAFLPATLRTGCKINLSLRITGVRADGYHELDSLFFPLREPHDTLYIRAGDRPGLTFVCDAGLDPENNTVTAAYRAFADAAGAAPDLYLRLKKGILQGAGLGGGSADAGCLLRFLNSHAQRPLEREALVRVAVSVGADVPFFLENRPCRVQGIGEVLTPCTVELPGRHILLACPQLHVSTPWAYKAWDLLQREKDLKNLTVSEKLPIKIRSCCRQYVNDLEDAVFPRYPLLKELKEHLLRKGAAEAGMSGSGAAMFAIFQDARQAVDAANALQERGIQVMVQQAEDCWGVAKR